MNINDLRIDDWINIRLLQSCEVAQVTSIDIENNSISVRTETNDSLLIDTPDKWEQIIDVILSNDLLIRLGFYKYENGTIYEKSYTGNDTSLSIHLINERGEFSWVTEDADAYFRRRTTPVQSLRELQHLFYDTYGVEMHINLF